MTGLRRFGYRVLGPALDYLLHLRPAEWPIVAGHFLTGSALALGLSGLMRSAGAAPALVGAFAWVVLLNGGTLAINSAFDRDTGDIAYLRRPPPPPRGLFPFGLALMLAGLGLAWPLGGNFRAAYGVCFALSVLYSVPPARLKARAGFDWVINLVGFGALTPFAGWAASGVPLTEAGLLVVLGFAALFGSIYPLTQLYQLEEDQRRGDRTLATALGVRRSLLLAHAMAVLAFLLFAQSASRSGWEGTSGLGRAAVLLLAAAAWAAVLVPWLVRADLLRPEDHHRGMYRALWAWALTDVAVLVGWAL